MLLQYIEKSQSQPTKNFFELPDINKHRIFCEQTKKSWEHEPTTKMENLSMKKTLHTHIITGHGVDWEGG